MGDKLSGKPRGSSIGEEISHSVIPQRWRLLLQLLLSVCPIKPQKYSAYARLENPFLLNQVSTESGEGQVTQCLSGGSEVSCQRQWDRSGKRALLCQEKTKPEARVSRTQFSHP